MTFESSREPSADSPSGGSSPSRTHPNGVDRKRLAQAVDILLHADVLMPAGELKARVSDAVGYTPGHYTIEQAVWRVGSFAGVERTREVDMSARAVPRGFERRWGKQKKSKRAPKAVKAQGAKKPAEGPQPAKTIETILSNLLQYMHEHQIESVTLNAQGYVDVTQLHRSQFNLKADKP